MQGETSSDRRVLQLLTMNMNTNIPSRMLVLIKKVVGIRPLAMSEWFHRRAKSNSRERVLQGPAVVIRWRNEQARRNMQYHIAHGDDMSGS